MLLGTRLSCGGADPASPSPRLLSPVPVPPPPCSMPGGGAMAMNRDEESDSDDEDDECPLCMEPFEVDDRLFYPCTCGYQVRSPDAASGGVPWLWRGRLTCCNECTHVRQSRVCAPSACLACFKHARPQASLLAACGLFRARALSKPNPSFVSPPPGLPLLLAPDTE